MSELAPAIAHLLALSAAQSAASSFSPAYAHPPPALDSCGDDAATTSAASVPWEADTWDAQRADAAAAALADGSGRGAIIKPFFASRILASQTKAWDCFYQVHRAGFFLERSYLERDFPCLTHGTSAPYALLEIGCGTGASFLPLLPRLPHLRVTAFDLSPRAVTLAVTQAAALGCTHRVCAFVGDAAAAHADGSSSIAAQVATATAASTAPTFDAVLMLFALSALPPEAHARAIAGAAACLRPGGLLLLRDYGAGDEAQLRFNEKGGNCSRLDADGSVMVRGDGTLAAFLRVETLRAHAASAGLEDTACDAAWHDTTCSCGGVAPDDACPPSPASSLTAPCCGVGCLYRAYSNRAVGTRFRRVWVHAVWRKQGGSVLPPRAPPLVD